MVALVVALTLLAVLVLEVIDVPSFVFEEEERDKEEEEFSRSKEHTLTEDVLIGFTAGDAGSD